MNITSFWSREADKQKSPHIALESVHVASPCPASWEKMKGDDRVRHCQECRLSVYNLSEMTREEAERLISSREGRVCVRFYLRADGTILTRDCPRGLRALSERISRTAGAALSALMALTPAWAQAPQANNAQAQSASKDAQFGMDITVVDPTGAVIPNAKVELCRCKSKITNNTKTDAAGAARFNGLSKSTYELVVNAPGFKTSRQTVILRGTLQRRVKMQIGSVITTVQVNAEQGGVTDVLMGSVSAVQSPMPTVTIAHPSPAPMR